MPSIFAGHHRVRRKAHGPQVGEAPMSHAAVGSDSVGSRLGSPRDRTSACLPCCAAL